MINMYISMVTVVEFHSVRAVTLTQKVLQAIKNSFEYADWSIKIHFISPDTLRNSTTVITLINICFATQILVLGHFPNAKDLYELCSLLQH